MRKLAIANQKGGVGKSTLTAHLAWAAAAAGLRVLLVDMDKQGSLSLIFQAPEGAAPGLLASELYEATPPADEPQRITDNLFIIRADDRLLSIDKAENNVIRRPAQALARFESQFDVCFIDTPPLLGVRLMASLTAADYVLTPVSIGLLELAGVADLMQTIHVIRTQGFNPRLRHIGILPVKTNNRSAEERQGLAGLRTRYGNAILPAGLPERAPVRKAIARRIPVWQGTRGEGHLIAAKEWREACEIILGRMGK